MRRTLLVAALVLSGLVSPRASRAEPPADGTIETEGARIEILGKPVRVGERIDLPEGFIRVEEAGTEDEHVGSFSVVPAASLRATADAWGTSRGAPPAAPAAEPDLGVGAAGTPPALRAALRSSLGGQPPPAACRGERNAYLREVWKASGIDVKDADALIEGLEGAGQGAAAGFFWFAFASDPFRPLAWSSDLRSAAEALSRCVREQRESKVAGR